jgi:Ankyrin repeats (3 copies)
MATSHSIIVSGKRKADSLGRIAAQARRRTLNDGRMVHCQQHSLGPAGEKETPTAAPSPSATTTTTTTKNSQHPPWNEAHPESMRESRDATQTTTTTTTGRGASTGWTLCPLCGRHSQKRFALGRGIAAHLHAVHTPWKPGKAERQKRRRLAERQTQEGRKRQQPCAAKCTTTTSSSSTSVAQQKERAVLSSQESQKVVSSVKIQETWDPTPKERREWDERVLQIVAEVEEKAHQSGDDVADDDAPQYVQPGRDRRGQISLTYVDSLPSFLQAAANGDLNTLQAMIQQAVVMQQEPRNPETAIGALLDTRDRHLSLAEHWAAGGGHLECLKYLFELRDQYSDHDSHNSNNKKTRRRDGKTCLHYAARNGQMSCLVYLVEERKQTVDERSGDGTTPFHLACFGGHAIAAQYLLDHGADPCAKNDWGCNAAHWVGLSSSSAMMTRDEMWSLCQLLQSHGVSFVQQQKQGHSALHKAAQRRNFHVIDWISDASGAGLTVEERTRAGQPDNGGHKPSDIWLSFGGSAEFAQRMRDDWGW